MWRKRERVADYDSSGSRKQYLFKDAVADVVMDTRAETSAKDVSYARLKEVMEQRPRIEDEEWVVTIGE